MSHAGAAVGLRGHHQALLVRQEPSGSFVPIQVMNGTRLHGGESEQQCQLRATCMAQSQPAIKAAAAPNRSGGTGPLSGLLCVMGTLDLQEGSKERL